MEIKVRYNTKCTDDILYWRVLINGTEHLASDVEIHTTVKTTKDFIPEVGFKHHITCNSDNIKWIDKKLIVR